MVHDPRPSIKAELQPSPQNILGSSYIPVLEKLILRERRPRLRPPSGLQWGSEALLRPKDPSDQGLLERIPSSHSSTTWLWDLFIGIQLVGCSKEA